MKKKLHNTLKKCNLWYDISRRIKMTKRRKQNHWWIIMTVIIMIVGGVVFAVIASRPQGSDEPKGDESIVEEPGDTVEKKEGGTEVSNDKSDTTEKKKVEQYDGDDPNTADSLSGVVTYAGVNGNNFSVRVNIDQYLENGKCELILKRNDATIYSSIANIISNASTATCEGFDVPVENLGGGMVSININLSADGRTGQIRGEGNI